MSMIFKHNLMSFGTAFAGVFSALALAVPAYAQTADEPSSRDTIDDWVVECFGTSPGGELCQAFQRVLTQNPNVVALSIAVSPSGDDDGVMAEMALPLGVNLSAPPVLAVGDDLLINLAWSHCVSTGCFVRGRLGGAIVEALMTAPSAAVQVTHLDGNVIAIPISTKGFAEAIKAISIGDMRDDN
ncbi:MAG: invasion protein IalB [Loktanella salsilacus]|jgi:invasion protein IalB|uniref:invasion associated locus B family protein n=1 Tax=Loktanella salsilacus TaxID=195913 RepID=UPI003988FB7D